MSAAAEPVYDRERTKCGRLVAGRRCRQHRLTERPVGSARSGWRSQFAAWRRSNDWACASLDGQSEPPEPLNHRRGRLSAMAVYPLSDWGTTLLRLSAFPVEPERRTDLTWWAQVAGSEPEINVERKMPRSLEQSGVLEQGNRLVLRIDPTRIDWLAVPSEPTPGDLPDIIGPFPDVLPQFLALVKKWSALSDRPPIHRLALGAILNHPEATAKSGYERLSKYLPAIKIDTDKSHDFLFQINRPVVSNVASVAGLGMNRLSKWLVQTIQVMHLGPSGMTQNEGIVTLLELDISTDAKRKDPLPDAAFDGLIDELGLLGIEIASSGDPL
jgi:hypothetical protein